MPCKWLTKLLKTKQRPRNICLGAVTSSRYVITGNQQRAWTQEHISIGRWGGGVDIEVCIATYMHTQPEGTTTCSIKKDKQLQMVCVNHDAVFVTDWVARSSSAAQEVTAYRWSTATTTHMNMTTKQRHGHYVIIRHTKQTKKKVFSKLKQKQKQRSHTESPVYCWVV